MKCRVCHQDPCVCNQRVADALMRPVIMDKAFIERVLPTIPTEILVTEVAKRLGIKHQPSTVLVRARTISFRRSDRDLPPFPLYSYAFPIDVARHWLLRADIFTVSRLREACGGERIQFGEFDASRAVQRLRETGEVRVVEDCGRFWVYAPTDSLHFSVSEENMRRAE